MVMGLVSSLSAIDNYDRPGIGGGNTATPTIGSNATSTKAYVGVFGIKPDNPTGSLKFNETKRIKDTLKISSTMGASLKIVTVVSTAVG